jgi:hypothetical protein
LTDKDASITKAPEGDYQTSHEGFTIVLEILHRNGVVHGNLTPMGVLINITPIESINNPPDLIVYSRRERLIDISERRWEG